LVVALNPKCSNPKAGDLTEVRKVTLLLARRQPRRVEKNCGASGRIETVGAVVSRKILTGSRLPAIVCSSWMFIMMLPIARQRNDPPFAFGGGKEPPAVPIVVAMKAIFDALDRGATSLSRPTRQPMSSRSRPVS